MKSALEGIRVLDFSRALAGPYCSWLLARMGAEVIRVERPGGEFDRTMGVPIGDTVWAFFFFSTACNKKCITLNLRTDKGMKIAKELAKRSDVILHNSPPGDAKAVGMEYDIFREVNPGIIFAAITGFGQTGPYKNRPALDAVIQAISGAMSLTGFPDKPPTRPAISYIDYGTGLLTAFGIVLALYHREKTGVGQMIDAALMDTALSFIAGSGLISEYKLFEACRLRLGNSSFWTIADCFKAKDAWVFLYIHFPSAWKGLVKLIGSEELANNPTFQIDYMRFYNRHLINPIISEWVAGKTAAEVVSLMEKIGVPCAPVSTIPDLIDDPQVKVRGMLEEVEYPGIGKLSPPGMPLKLSETPGKAKERPPLLGEHNEEIYRSILGFGPEELSQLQKERVV